MVSFAEPLHLLWLALPAAGALAVLWRHRARMAQQRSLASPSVWRQLLGGAPSTGLGRMLAWCAAAALIVLALARPQWGVAKGEVSVRTRDVAVAVDVSDSMRCQDVAPSRLKRGLAVLRRALPGLDGNRLAVVVFSGDAYPLVPLTTDLEAVGTFLEGVEPGMIALPGSNLERAVDQSLKLLPPEGKGRVLVVISDGENLQGDVKAAAARLRNAGVRMVAVVSGTKEGGPIPVAGGGRGTVRYKRDRSGNVVITHAHPEVLRKLARSTGGVLIDGGDGTAAQEIVRAIAKLQSREMESSRRVRRIDRFPLFLVGAAVLVLLGFALSPWRKVAVAALFVLAVVPAAGAQTVPPAGARAAPPPAGAPASPQGRQAA
ncbi:MAG: VWA domain-containing protein, partial [Acidobacteria bacterium]|nr:VWA domain-containing protein [Acidobacteriota bacterium]